VKCSSLQLFISDAVVAPGARRWICCFILHFVSFHGWRFV